MKRIAVLGSTGSIGRQTLDVVRANPDEFKIIALCAGTNAALLARQAEEFCPVYLGMTEETAHSALMANHVRGELIVGPMAAETIASLPEADLIVNGISGFSGMAPLLAALEAEKTVALANKESIVCAHALVDEALKRGGQILPVDSEQSAIFQCLQAGRKEDIARLILTASGGPFWNLTKEQLREVSPEQAGKHPTWNMGKKITIDSASLFNKGLEIMEASYLFGIGGERISVLVHPESIVHSLVEYQDGSTLAQLSRPDMRLAIQYALTYPHRQPSDFGRLRLEEAGTLTFFAPDRDRFPAIPLAYEALREGAVLPIVYNGANEAAVAAFLRGEIRFTDISVCVEYAMAHIRAQRPKCAGDIYEIDRQARELAGKANH